MDINGKVVTTARKQDDTTITETLGYTNVNPFSASSASAITTLRQFGMAITGLTTNVYKKTSVTYDVTLDTWTED